MADSVDFPAQGVVFWPVACGDCSTVVLDDRRVIQVDIRDLGRANDDEPDVAAVIDRLVEVLPRTSDGVPYLSVFILTHADQDHCLGFGELLRRVRIGELWATPRIWRDVLARGDDLCDDAQAFADEVQRRVDATLAAVAAGKGSGAGDRVRVVGYDTDHEQHAYSELPSEYLSYPGEALTMIDGENLERLVEIFIHAPFKDDCAAPRNETSLAFQLTLRRPDSAGSDAKVLFFGDLAHETLMKIFTYSSEHDRADRLEWDVLLAPHHCSKKVMFTIVDGVDTKQQDILDALERHARPGATVVASSGGFPSTDTVGANPPHLKARRCYEALAEDFRCTHEEPTADDPAPLIFALGEAGLGLADPAATGEPRANSEVVAKAAALAAGATAVGLLGRLVADWWRNRPLPAPRRSGTAAARAAVQTSRGDETPPTQVVGFGR
jgi:hypothetical protein